MTNEKRLRISVRVNPRAATDELISWQPELGSAEVYVKAPPEKNKANLATLKLLKKHTKKQIFLVAGHTRRQKVFEIIG